MVVRRVAAIGLFLSVAACSYTGDVDAGLNGLMGKPIDAAIAKLGYPDGQVELKDRIVYTWNDGYSGSYTTNDTSTSYQHINGQLTAVTVTTPVTQNYSHQCEIRIVTDRKGVIRDWERTGDWGCANYADALSN